MGRPPEDGRYPILRGPTTGFVAGASAAKKTTIRRKVIYVPAEYGRLVTVSGGPEGAMLWFDQNGELRNVRVSRRDVMVKRDGVLTLR